MTIEESGLLLKDLCARLAYGVKVCFDDIEETTLSLNELLYINSNHKIIPYLRPMKSMTSEEYESIKKEFLFYGGSICMTSDMLMSGEVVDWLNAHHFDYRGLIDKGLALEAPEGMYKL